MQLKCHNSSLPVTLDLGAPLGVGGEARVYTLVNSVAMCAKIYHDPTPAQARKLAAMLANPPDDPMSSQGLISIAWPVDTLHVPDINGNFVGFLMPRATNMRPLFKVYNPVTRRKETPLFNYEYLHRAGRNIAAAVRGIHRRGYVIGDINESNVLIDPNTALVTLVDTDSFQVSDATDGAIYRCRVAKPEYTPPELQNTNFRLVDRRPEHDLFGLAILIFQLLMEGAHPFSGIYQGAAALPAAHCRGPLHLWQPDDTLQANAICAAVRADRSNAPLPLRPVLYRRTHRRGGATGRGGVVDRSEGGRRGARDLRGERPASIRLPPFDLPLV